MTGGGSLAHVGVSRDARGGAFHPSCQRVRGRPAVGLATVASGLGGKAAGEREAVRLDLIFPENARGWTKSEQVGKVLGGKKIIFVEVNFIRDMPVPLCNSPNLIFGSKDLFVIRNQVLDAYAMHVFLFLLILAMLTQIQLHSFMTFTKPSHDFTLSQTQL